MKVFELKRLVVSRYLLTLLVITLWPASLHAAPGITSNEARPHFSSLKNQEQFTDMRVKVLGGYVRMTRRWDGQEWVWNSRWGELATSREISIAQEQRLWFEQGNSEGLEGSPVSRYQSSPPPLLYRAGQVYRKVAAREGYLASYENQLDQYIDMHEEGFTWHDTRGNAIYYDRYGQLVGYSDREGVKVHVERDEHGYIQRIKDHHDNVVLDYAWEEVPGVQPVVQVSGDVRPPKRLVSLTDYTQRQVSYHWDESGRLTRINDVRGSDWSIAYSDSGNLNSIEDPDGRETRYTINSSGRLYGRVNADGVGVEYTFDHDDGRDEYYLSEEFTTGEVRETWYNAMGQIVRVREDGETIKAVSIQLSDNSAGPETMIQVYTRTQQRWYRGIGSNKRLVNIIEVVTPDPPSEEIVYIRSRTTTDASGNRTIEHFDQWKNLTAVTYPDGTQVVKEWDGPNALLLKETDERGIIHRNEYNDKGWRTKEIHAEGSADQRVTHYEHDDFGQITAIVRELEDGRESVTRFEYDEYGNIVRMTDPEGGVTRWSDYDALGNARYRVDPEANAGVPNGSDDELPETRWKYHYDAAGNLLAEVNPLGESVHYEYDATGHLSGVTDALEYNTALETNAVGLPTKVIDPLDAELTLEYDKAYRPLATTDALGHVSEARYDNRGRIERQIDGEGNSISYVYRDDRLAEVHYPTYTEGYSYNSREQVTQVLQEANDRHYLRAKDYDLAGQLETVTDAMGNTQVLSYDDLGRVVGITDPEGGHTELRYNALDQVTLVRDPEGRVTRYTYDLKGRLTAEYKGEGSGQAPRVSYNYDGNDNLIAVTNAAGEVTRYDYNTANRLVQQRVYADTEARYPVKVVDFHHNANGQLTGYTQQRGTTSDGEPVRSETGDTLALGKTVTYTPRGEIETVTADFGGFSKTYSYTYYPNGLRQTYTNPEGITYTYYYNRNNQLTAVHLPGSGQLSLKDYHWLQPQTLLLPGGGRITLSYTDFLQVEERILEDPAQNSIAEALYEYDLAHNITGIQASEGLYRFDYDNNYRLVVAEYPELVAANDEVFDYDGVGNRIVHTQGDDLTEADYGDYNQLRGISDDDGERFTFTYNANGHTETRTDHKTGEVTEYRYNHEERLVAVRRNGVTVAEYAYNPEGHRIRKRVGGQTTWFLYNEEGLAAEYDAQGNLIKEYHFKPYSPWMTEPLFQRVQAGQVYYYQNDHLGTPQRLLASNGAVVWQAYYSAFGEAFIEIEQVQNNLRFPGQYFDAETGLHHNYFRDYDPALGRYIQSDPIGLSGGLNTYIYGLGNPLFWHDPNGLICIPPRVIGAISGAVGGAVGGMVSGLPGGFPGVLAGMTTGAALGAISGAVGPNAVGGAIGGSSSGLPGIIAGAGSSVAQSNMMSLSGSSAEMQTAATIGGSFVGGAIGGVGAGFSKRRSPGGYTGGFLGGLVGGAFAAGTSALLSTVSSCPDDYYDVCNP